MTINPIQPPISIKEKIKRSRMKRVVNLIYPKNKLRNEIDWFFWEPTTSIETWVEPGGRGGKRIIKGSVFPGKTRALLENRSG